VSKFPALSLLAKYGPDLVGNTAPVMIHLESAAFVFHMSGTT
jgi:hypothetical protein